MDAIDMPQRLVLVYGEDADLAVYGAWDVDEPITPSREAVWELELRFREQLQCLIDKSLVLRLVALLHRHYIVLFIAVERSMAVTIAITVCDVAPTNDWVEIFAL